MRMVGVFYVTLVDVYMEEDLMQQEACHLFNRPKT